MTADLDKGRRAIGLFAVAVVGAVIKRTLVQPLGLAGLLIQSNNKLLVCTIEEEIHQPLMQDR